MPTATGSDQKGHSRFAANCNVRPSAAGPHGGRLGGGKWKILSLGEGHCGVRQVGRAFIEPRAPGWGRISARERKPACRRSVHDGHVRGAGDGRGGEVEHAQDEPSIACSRRGWIQRATERRPVGGVGDVGSTRRALRWLIPGVGAEPLLRPARRSFQSERRRSGGHGNETTSEGSTWYLATRVDAASSAKALGPQTLDELRLWGAANVHHLKDDFGEELGGMLAEALGLTEPTFHDRRREAHTKARLLLSQIYDAYRVLDTDGAAITEAEEAQAFIESLVPRPQARNDPRHRTTDLPAAGARRGGGTRRRRPACESIRRPRSFRRRGIESRIAWCRRRQARDGARRRRCMAPGDRRRAVLSRREPDSRGGRLAQRLHAEVHMVEHQGTLVLEAALCEALGDGASEGAERSDNPCRSPASRPPRRVRFKRPLACEGCSTAKLRRVKAALPFRSWTSKCEIWHLLKNAAHHDRVVARGHHPPRR